MTYKHLKERSYYEELYDRHTVEECRFFEKPETESHSQNKHKDEDISPEQFLGIFTLARDLMLFQVAGNRCIGREQALNEWMARDEKRDALVEQSRPPLVRCPSCGKAMECERKDLGFEIDKDRDWVEFWFHCKPCRKVQHVYENGREIPRKPSLCAKCNKEVEFSMRKKKGKTYYVHTCKHCGHVEEIISVLDEEKKAPTQEEIDRFEYDEKRFCLSPEQGRRYQNWKDRSQRIDAQEKEHEMNIELHDKLAEVRKLSIAGLEKLLKSVLEKEGYIDFHVTMPASAREIILNFSARDTKDKREEYDSRHTLKKAIEGALQETNWALMSEGVSYRLGMLSGRIKAYESEKELQELTRSRLKKKTKSGKSESGIELDIVKNEVNF